MKGMERNNSEFAKNYYWGKLRYDELRVVLEQIDFPYVILKGEVLSVYMNNQVATRGSNDVDILVDKSNIGALTKILKNSGFESSKEEKREDLIYYLTFAHQIAPYRKRKGSNDIYVDINFDLFWGGYQGRRIDINSFLEDAITMNIYGVNVKTLPLYKTLIALILHHYKDFNSIFLLASSKSITEKKIMEIYCLIVNNIERFVISEFIELCGRYGVQQYAYYMLYYVNEFCRHSNRVICEIVEKVWCAEGEALLNVYGLEKKHTWKIDFFQRLNNDNLFEEIRADLSPDELRQISTCSEFY